jgi:ribosomal protein S12 methylthiotransferase accessory factor
LQVPVFTSVTPMAKDLTTHLGKGMDKEAARVGAVMEAIERISAQELDGKLHQFTYSELTSCGANVADPLWFDLPRASSYRQDRKFEWVEGWELVSSRPIWILADLARSPATEQILDQVDTNGLAAGFTHSQALRSGILEVVERDAVSQHHFFHRFGQAGDRGPVGRRIDMTSLPPGPGALADRARNAGLELILEDLTTDLQIPVISSTLIDRAFPGVSGPMPLVAEGWGADLRAAAAATHAILESFQSRLGVIHGARDSYNQMSSFPGGQRGGSNQMSTQHDFSTIPEMDLPDLKAEIEFVLERLNAVGLQQAIIIDLARKSFGVPVVRVRVPGLSLFAIDSRRVGWRSARHVL